MLDNLSILTKEVEFSEVIRSRAGRWATIEIIFRDDNAANISDPIKYILTNPGDSDGVFSDQGTDPEATAIKLMTGKDIFAVVYSSKFDMCREQLSFSGFSGNSFSIPGKIEAHVSVLARVCRAWRNSELITLYPGNSEGYIESIGWEDLPGLRD